MAVTRIQIYNQIFNLTWTTVCLAPVVWLWYVHYHATILIVMFSVSLLTILIPAGYLNLLQVSKSRKFYESLAIKSLQSLTQNGGIVLKLANKQNQNYRVIKSKAGFRSFASRIAMYEKYHISCLVFFLISFIYAIYCGELLISFLIFLSNIIYNIIPILIQQYNKLRLGFL